MSKDTDASYKFGSFYLDKAECSLKRQGKLVPLTQKALQTLIVLVEHSGHLVEKDALMLAVWGDTFVEEANLAQHIFLLRKALGQKDGGRQYIETIPRRGYRFIAPVTRLPPPSDGQTPRPSSEAKDDRGIAAEQSPPLNLLAVLPLINESSDEKAEYLANGITESIIHTLSQLPQLRVMAHSSVLRYKGLEVDPREIGRELGVHAVLTGRVLLLEERLVIRTELVEVRSGWQLWGTQYDRPVSDILSIQEEIAKKISDKLKLKLSSDEKKLLVKRYTEHTEAYHLYLRGRYFLNQYYEKSVMKGIKCFQQAIELDADYALAYTGLADSYYRLSSLKLSPPEAMSKAKTAAVKAVLLDDDLAEAHASLGLIKLYYEFDWAGAVQEYRRAINLNHSFSITHMRYGTVLMLRKFFDESMVELKQALELDPLSLRINITIGTCLYLRGWLTQAAEQYQKLLELDQDYYPAHFSIGMVYLRQQRYKEAIAKFRQACELAAQDTSVILAYIGYTYALSGNQNEARKILARLQARLKEDYVSPYGIAIIYTALGEKERALQWLEKTYEERNDWLLWLDVAIEFESLHSDSRFVSLLERIGFSKSLE